MKLTFNWNHKIQWLFFIVIFSGLLSCMNYITYKGHEVAEEDRLPIHDGGPNHGFWQTNDLSVNYVYHKTANDIQLSGEISFAVHLMNSFSSLDSFHLRIYFLDGDGRIIEGKGIFYSGYKVSIENMEFNRRLSLPADTTAMVFSYTGTASDQSGDEGKLNYEFWKSPVSRRIF